MNNITQDDIECAIDDLEDAAIGYVGGAPEDAKELARKAVDLLRAYHEDTLAEGV